MKEFIDLFTEDFRKEGFTKRDALIYGLAFPVFVVIGCIVGGLL